jgi:hypothetical protein
MDLEKEIDSIREAIKAGRFVSEAAVSQGIVLRLLHALDWPTYDTQVVWPEYSLSGRRVDFALCNLPRRPIAFIEIKQIGQSDGAERQLFEYAFHDGVPMAILTDGREWNFFLPGEQGDYVERRVYNLDLIDRELAECAMRLRRYLMHSAVISGDAMRAAREDYRHVSKDRQMLAALPKAWAQIIDDEDEMLLEIVADRVESLCGFKPEPDMVAKFLKSGTISRAFLVGQPLQSPAQPARPPRSGPSLQPISQPVARSKSSYDVTRIGFDFKGEFHQAKNAIDVLRQVFETLTRNDSSFPERFAGLPKHGNKRRYLANDPNELYPGRPDLCIESACQLTSGWWLGTNHSRQTIGRIIEMACEVARVQHGKDIVANLG